MLTIRPLVLLSCQWRTARRHNSALAVKLICMVRFQLSRHWSSSALTRFASNTPALLIRTSTRPSSLSSEFSHSFGGIAGSARLPSWLDSASTSTSSGSNAAAMAAPIPRDAPVTRMFILSFTVMTRCFSQRRPKFNDGYRSAALAEASHKLAGIVMEQG